MYVPKRIDFFTDVSKDKEWEATLTSPYMIDLGGGAVITIPAGFVTDGASVPRVFWSIVPPWGLYLPAALVHDYLYHTGMTLADSKVGEERARADIAFRDIMDALGVPEWKRNIMYFAVKTFGGGPWKDARSKDKKE